jgi:hypothetical protein
MILGKNPGNLLGLTLVRSPVEPVFPAVYLLGWKPASALSLENVDMEHEPSTPTAVEVFPTSTITDIEAMTLDNLPDTALDDDELIARVRGLHESTERHLKRSIQDFWLLGASLNSLFKRRHLYVTTTWESFVADEVGIGRNTASQARRLASSCEFSALGQFRNRTDGLRQLKILASPKSSVASDKPDADVSDKPNVSDKPDGKVKSKSSDIEPAVKSDDDVLDVLAMIGMRLDSLTIDKPDKEVKAQLNRIVATARRLLKPDEKG